MTAVAVPVVAVFIGILINLVTLSFVDGYARWVKRSRWNLRLVIVLILLLALGSSMVVKLDGSSQSATGTPPAAKTVEATDQERADGIHTGMPEEALVALLGLPSGRFRAPDNPYGVLTELVFSSETLIVQALLGEAGSVKYYSITARQHTLKLRVPPRSSTSLSTTGKDDRFVLNQTPFGVRNKALKTMFGYFGVSFLNFGVVEESGPLVYGGRETIFGMNIFATGAEGGGVHVLEALREGDVAPKWSPPSSECLSALEVDNSIRNMKMWVTKACGSSNLILPSEQEEVLVTPAWKLFEAEGTVDTFAETEPNLFKDYPSEIFYSIWDLGPKEGVLP